MRNVLLACPRYGPRSDGSYFSAFKWASLRPQDTRVHAYSTRGSLLCAVFNDCWCYALNKRKEEGFTHFAMIHADVSAEQGWLDTLIDLLEQYDLDVVSSVILIKGDKVPAETSTGLAWSDDIFENVHILNIDEVKGLPDVFMADDAVHYLNGHLTNGHPPFPATSKLLLNTGLWVCRFDKPWIEQFHFSIKDEIRFSEEYQCYETRVASEDWNASRQWQEWGLRIAATRVVQNSHIGEWAFSMTP